MTLPCIKDSKSAEILTMPMQVHLLWLKKTDGEFCKEPPNKRYYLLAADPLTVKPA
jgi:hypothetical protein